MNVRDCDTCAHFRGSPAHLETELPGMASLSSAYAAVRAGDGLCVVHGRYVAATSRCDRHFTRTDARGSR